MDKSGQPTPDNPLAPGWNANRATRWLANLAGLEAMLAQIDTPLIEALKLDAPFRVAEVGCGGGATSHAILRDAPSGTMVDGFDITPSLIEWARTRFASVEPNLHFDVADIQTAAPPNGPYDRLASRFGVMFFPDPQAAFANLRRWLLPGGRFAFAVWGPLVENHWMTVLREVVSLQTALPKTDPSAPGPFRYGEVATLLNLLGEAGFEDLRSTTWHGTLPVGTGLAAPGAATFALDAFSNFADLLEQAGDQARHRAEEDLARRFSSQEQNGIVRMGACVHVVSGS